MKRVQAESDAQAAAQRLTVAQQQFGEYVAERAAAEHALAKEVGRLEAMVAQTVLSSQADDGHGNGSKQSGVEPVLSEILRLKECILTAAEEAQTTARLIKEETERLVVMTKRTSADANLMVSDSEMKRPKDDAGDGNHAGSRLKDDDLQSNHAEESNDEKTGFLAPDVDGESFRERAKYIPLRLTHEERRLLRLLEGALNVSEYTDKVDILSYKSKSARVHAQIRDLCAILCGLTVAQNFKRGQKLITDRDFDQLATFFQDCFEVGRRHKVMNPERMRDSYGKLIYMLMDSSEPEMEELLEFQCVRPLRTVASLLEEAGALAMLDDPLLPVATAEIMSSGRSRAAIQRDIRSKEKARDILARKYRSKNIDEEDLLRCMYSIGDNNTFLAFTRDPIDKMIIYLKTFFKPDGFESTDLSLAIHAGAGGARLSHSHSRQYSYVLQSLTLWREIMQDMFKLWCLAEGDMTNGNNRYRLANTGQGLQRIQAAPSVARAMHNILSRCQRRVGSWVGSSVVHLGDHNVPNALMFIDKYTQVPRILNPVVLVLEEIPRMVKNPAIASLINGTFGGVEAVKKEILCDFFRHAFDGSGADNFFDAGSCIDGRLTSAWNWCSKIEKKRYYPVFQLAGFVGFDGDFK